MLKKLSDINIPEKEPFRNDKLNRKEIADNLTNLIKSTSEPFVMSINSQWGDGKTTFIKMLCQYLINDGHPCIYFNSWENDFSDDPLVCFISEIDQYVENKAFRSKKTKIFKRVKGLSKQLSIIAIPLIIKFATQGLLDMEMIKEYIKFDEGQKKELENFVSNVSKEKISDYKKQKDSVVSFRNNLQKIAKELTQRTNRKAPLVIFVDELDRCRPSFAISLLENIKHLFSVPDIVFVLGIDRGQLSHMVKSLYGMGMDADGYLRRFIDLEFSLPEPDKRLFPDYLYDKFNLEEIRVPSRYVGDIKNFIILRFSLLANSFNLSLRIQSQCFTQLNLALRLTSNNSLIGIRNFIFLICLKAKSPELYYNLNNKIVTIEEIKSYIQKMKGGDDFVNSKFWLQFESILWIFLNSPDNYDKIKKKVSEKIDSNPNQFQSEELRIEFFHKLNSEIHRNFDAFNYPDRSNYIQEFYFNRIEMTGQFSF